MTQKHTPEPWGVFQDASGDVFVSSKETSFHICEVGSEDDDSVIHDARRIVACVNAMIGIGDDNALLFPGNSVRSVISNMKLKELELEQQRDDLQAQIDELLAALKTIGTHTITDEDGDEIEVLFGNIGKIGDVITKYTGETK